MFPHLRQRLLAQVDLLVEFSTLGEYGLDECGAVMPLDCTGSSRQAPPRLRERCTEAARGERCATAPRHAGRARS